jgi:hypothetical protein
MQEENGMTNKFIPKALSKGNPATLSKGILIEPPPIPNIPLIKPEKIPIKKYGIISINNSI